MEPCYERKYSICLYYSSHSFILSFLYALYRKQYHFSIIPASIFFTSIQYWKYPTQSYRRYVDILVVNTLLPYQLYRSTDTKYANLHFVLCLSASLFFPISIYFYNKKHHWLSTFLHMSLHILSNAANIVLYSGQIKTVSSCSKSLFK